MGVATHPPSPGCPGDSDPLLPDVPETPTSSADPEALASSPQKSRRLRSPRHPGPRICHPWGRPALRGSEVPQGKIIGAGSSAEATGISLKKRRRLSVGSPALEIAKPIPKTPLPKQLFSKFTTASPLVCRGASVPSGHLQSLRTSVRTKEGGTAIWVARLLAKASNSWTLRLAA